jgi:hypothetical protein
MAGLKGALISFTPSFVGAVPNVIVFQINPETISHTWDEPEASRPPAGVRTNYDPLAVTGVPGEKFSFTLILDSNDDIADATTNPIAAASAVLSGAYPRLAALEMLQYPMASFSTLLGQVSSTLSTNSAGAPSVSTINVPASQVPVVLFVWGPARIVPVRVTDLQITEQLYDELLNPVHAEAQIGLRVLTPDELAAVQEPMRDIANVAYVYTQGLRQAQAAANLGATAAASIIGMLPTPF